MKYCSLFRRCNCYPYQNEEIPMTAPNLACPKPTLHILFVWLNEQHRFLMTETTECFAPFIQADIPATGKSTPNIINQ